MEGISEPQWVEIGSLTRARKRRQMVCPNLVPVAVEQYLLSSLDRRHQIADGDRVVKWFASIYARLAAEMEDAQAAAQAAQMAKVLLRHLEESK
jgi:hypothetical protein